VAITETDTESSNGRTMSPAESRMDAGIVFVILFFWGGRRIYFNKKMLREILSTKAWFLSIKL
jgi:hypothetical protein